jgi:ABC-type Mn2+/Zn2+ transport system permease subunit/glutaredoxin
LSYAFMLRGLVAALIVGVICPLLGTYVVLRGMAFFGDALAHIMLPGVVVAFLLGWPLGLGALITGILAALFIGAISRRTDIKEDAAIGVVFAGAFALGIALLSLQRSYAVDLAHLLFGNLLGVSDGDLWVSGALALLVIVTVGAFFKEFFVLSFDPVLATTLRLPVNVLQNLLLVLIAVVIVVSIQTVGVALVLAMLVTPASAAYLITRRLQVMMFVGMAIGAVSAVVGLYVSYYWDVASGPAIVLVETAIFLVMFGLAPRTGRIWTRRARSVSQDESSERKEAAYGEFGRPGEIVLYATERCPDCWRARRTLEAMQATYRVVDIDKDARARQLVEKFNTGLRMVPTIVFPDGAVLVEPTDDELSARLERTRPLHG